jgi:hypothetical protein
MEINSNNTKGVLPTGTPKTEIEDGRKNIGLSKAAILPNSNLETTVELSETIRVIKQATQELSNSTDKEIDYERVAQVKANLVNILSNPIDSAKRIADKLTDLPEKDL